jgi:hypothetical protein
MFSVLDTNLLIQANWRGRVMRNEFLDIKKKAIIVQSYFRMQRALKEYKIISDQRQVAAILIQSWVRRFLAGKKYQKLKQEYRYQISVKLYHQNKPKKPTERSSDCTEAGKYATLRNTVPHCEVCDMDFESTLLVYHHIIIDHLDVAHGREDGNARFVF